MKSKICTTLSKTPQISDLKTQRVYTRHYLYAKWHGKARRSRKFSAILFSEAICGTKPGPYRFLTCIRSAKSRVNDNQYVIMFAVIMNSSLSALRRSRLEALEASRWLTAVSATSRELARGRMVSSVLWHTEFFM